MIENEQIYKKYKNNFEKNKRVNLKLNMFLHEHQNNSNEIWKIIKETIGKSTL